MHPSLVFIGLGSGMQKYESVKPKLIKYKSQKPKIKIRKLRQNCDLDMKLTGF